MKRTSILCITLLFFFVFSAGAQTLILPITGVQAEEARTIVAFVAMTGGGNIIDQSGNTALAPAGGRAWGMGSRQGIVDLISQNKAQSAMGINVVPYGTGKMATIRTFDNKGGLSGVTDIQYTDPFEFWIKLQQPADTNRRANGGPVWVIYRQGVNRAEAGELIQLWLSDLTSMGSQGLKDLDDQTAGFELAMEALRDVVAPEAGSWTGILDRMIERLKKTIYIKDDRLTGNGRIADGYRRVQGWDDVGPENISFRYFYQITQRIPAGYPKDEPALIFDVSRQGNGTRIEVVRTRNTIDMPYGQGSFVVTYGSAQEFRRSLRANSLKLMDALYRGPLEFVRDDAVRSTWTTSSALTELKPNVAIPNTFIQVKRPPMAPGEIPGGGFYMTRHLITQREWESVMGMNPSAVKGADLPVHNVGLVEAMEYCNRASLRDGLMPAYDLFFWPGIEEERDFTWTTTGKDAPTWTERRTIYIGQKATIRANKYANGYRLPTADEWVFALTGGNGTSAQLIQGLMDSGEITDYGWFADNSGGRPQPVGRKKPINGFYDMLGNVSEYIFTGFPVDSTGRGPFANGVYSHVRGGDYRTTFTPGFYLVPDEQGQNVGLLNIIERYIIPSPSLREYSFVVRRQDNSTETKYIVPGFRIVRPVFDYWAYRSGS